MKLKQGSAKNIEILGVFGQIPVDLKPTKQFLNKQKESTVLVTKLLWQTCFYCLKYIVLEDLKSIAISSQKLWRYTTNFHRRTSSRKLTVTPSLMQCYEY